jgi:hypothetical protein
MGKKRIIVEVNEVDYKRLVEDARGVGATLSNYIRKAVGLPLERQGVKGNLSAPLKKTRRASIPKASR